MTTSITQQAIGKLLERFDFERMAAIMRLTGWKYEDNEGVRYFPNAEKLKSTAQELFEIALKGNKKKSSASTGGLEARIFTDELGDREVWLSFVAMGYLAVMKVACQRAESTVSHWARTQEWIECVTNTHGILPLIGLRYSFFEKCAQMSDRLSDDTLHETLWIWHDNEGATLESFRAHLDMLAGAEPGDVAEFSKWIQARVKQLQTKAEEFGLSKHSRDKILLAVAALKDATSETEAVTAKIVDMPWNELESER